MMPYWELFFEITFTEVNELIHITEYLKKRNSQEENSSSLLKM